MCAVPNSFISCFPSMLLRYFQCDFEVVSVAPVSTGITFALTLVMECICIVRCLCLKVFLTSFLITFYHHHHHHHTYTLSLALLFHYLTLSMFRMLIHPSSGACDLFVELCHGLYCSGSMCIMLWFGCGGVVSTCRLKLQPAYGYHTTTAKPQRNTDTH